MSGGEAIAQVARELGLVDQTLLNWVKAAKKGWLNAPGGKPLLKLFYLAFINISRKWILLIRDWKAALNRFTIQFEERMPQH